MATSGDNFRTLLDRLETLGKLNAEVQELTEAAKGSALRTAATAATSAKPKFRTAVQPSSPTATPTATPTAGGAAATPAATTTPQPGAKTPAASAAVAATDPAAAAGKTGPAMGGATGNDNSEYQANIQRNAQLGKDLDSFVANSQGRVAKPGELWSDPAAFKNAWEAYMNKHGGQAYRLLGDQEMLSALKQIWMRTGGTQLKESIERVDRTITQLMEQRSMLIEEMVRREPIFEEMNTAVRMLAEQDLSQRDIQRIFVLVDKYANSGRGATGAGGAGSGSSKTAGGDAAGGAAAPSDAEIAKAMSAGGGAAGGAADKKPGLISRGIKKLSSAWNKFDHAIGNSGPMRMFDSVIDDLQQKIIGRARGDSKLAKVLTAYANFARENPKMQKAIFVLFTAALATVTGATGPIGAGLLAAGLKLADRLLQQRLSGSAGATWASIKAGLVAALGASAFQYLSGSGGGGGGGGAAPVDTSGYPQGGDPYHGGEMPVSGREPTVWDQNDYAEPGGYNPTAVPAQAPAGGGGAPTGASGAATPPVDTSGYPQGGDPYRPDVAPAAAEPSAATSSNATSAAGTTVQPMPAPEVMDTDWFSKLSPEAQRWLGGADRTDPFILDRLIKAIPSAAAVIPPELVSQAAMDAARAASAAAGGPNLEEGRNRWIDYKRTARVNQLRESRGVPPTRNYYVTQEGVNHVFRIITNEGFWDTIKKIAGKAWRAGTTKITADNLNMYWRREDPRTGSVPVQKIVDFLRKMGVSDFIIQQVFAEMKLPYDFGGGGGKDDRSGEDDGRITTPTPPKPVPPQPVKPPPAQITDPASLLASFKQFTDADGTISPYVRGQLGAILKTALNTVQEDIQQLKFQRTVRKLA